MKKTETVSSSFNFDQQSGNIPSDIAGTSIAKYQPIVGTDVDGLLRSVNTKYNCITAMKEYESKSLEELRIEDYSANRKGENCSFDSKTHTKNLFGSINKISPFAEAKSPFGIISPVNKSPSNFSPNGQYADATDKGGSICTNLSNKSIFDSEPKTKNSLHTNVFGTAFGQNGVVSDKGTENKSIFIFDSTEAKKTNSLGTNVFGTAPSSSLFGANLKTVSASNCSPFGQNVIATDKGTENKCIFSTNHSNKSIFDSTEANKTNSLSTNVFGTAPSPSLFDANPKTISNCCPFDQNVIATDKGTENKSIFGNNSNKSIFVSTKGKKTNSLNTNVFGTAPFSSLFGAIPKTISTSNCRPFGQNVVATDNGNVTKSIFSTDLSSRSIFDSTEGKKTNSLDSNIFRTAPPSNPFGTKPKAKNPFEHNVVTDKGRKHKNIFRTKLSNKSTFDSVESKNENSLDEFQTMFSSDLYRIKPKTCSTDENEKTQSTSLVLPSYFSWVLFEEKLNSALDKKLQNIAKKEDLAPHNRIEENNFTVNNGNDIEVLRADNENLKTELNAIRNRLWQVDRNNRRNRIFVRGLINKETCAATDEFLEICANRLETAVQVTDTIKLRSGNAFVFALSSTAQVSAVITRRVSLWDAAVFIEKDYTVEERDMRYQLRMLSKKLNTIGNLKIRLGEFSLYVNDRCFSWLDGGVVAGSTKDEVFLKELLVLINYNCSIKLQEKVNSCFVRDSKFITRRTESLMISDGDRTLNLEASTSNSAYLAQNSKACKIRNNVSARLLSNDKPHNQQRRNSY